MMKQQSTLDLSALDINSNIAAKNYWRNRLSDFQFVNYFKRRELPVAALTAGMDSCAITADQAVKQAFNELAGSAAAKHIVLMAAIGALMSKYTSSADIMVFTPTYKNEDNRVGGDDIIPFRMHAAETLTFAELVAAVKDNLVRDLGYSNYPVERILGKAKTALPWSSCIGMMVDEIQSDAAFGELPVGLLFRFDTSEGGLSLNISYNGTLYLPAFVNTIASRFFNLLGKLLANRRVPLKSVALLTPDEKEKLFGEIVHCAQHSPLAASYHQERMWFIDYFEAGDLYEGGPVYHNIPLILDLEGTPDVPLLAQSVQTLLDRYAILRTVIENADDRITQREITVSGFQFRYAAIDSDQDVEAVTSEEINTPMKLDSLLVRGLLINKGEKRFRMVLVFHHAIADRYSVKLLARQLLDNYYAGGNAVPAVPVVPYHHFSTWQRERFEDLEFHLFPFWDQLLSGGRLKALELPTDRPRAKIHIYKAAVADIAWPQRITEKLLEYQAATGQNVGLILMAAFKVLLYRYARHEEIVIGASADNRNVETLKGMIGPVANLVVIRSFVREDQSFKNYLDTLSAIYDSCMAHSEMPFDKLVADLAPEKDMARTALFDVLFQYEETTNDLPSTAALLVTEQETNLGYGKYDLNLLLQLRDNRLAGKLVFNEEYLDSATVADFLHNFYELAYNLISSPDERLSSIPLLSAEAASSLLLSLDHSQVGYPSEATVHRLFERQAALHPGRTALAFNGDTMSYAALHAASDRVAAYLRNEGVKPGVIVGLLLERGMEVVVGMLGILKAGGAYLPLDVEYPASRKSYMISDSGMPFLLTARNVTDAGDYG
ncbi:Condensation domain-containing protein, partial [Chitinophaga eiseniae]